MALEIPSCRWRLSGVPGVMFDYAAKFEHDPTYKAITAPGLNLIENFEGIDSLTLSQHDQSNLMPWEKLKAFVQYLNGQNPNSVHYKVLYITRHGLGYHNVFEAQVGRDAWNVSSPNSKSIIISHIRNTGRTWTEMEPLFGQTPD